jgi:hypothetical protein
MSEKLPPTASVAARLDGNRLYAPAAERNAGALCDLLGENAPETGEALELASGTGQHVVAFARRLPMLVWQPTDIASERIDSIDAHVADADLANVRPALHLDASGPGWSRTHNGKDLITLVNLLHLISEDAAKTVVSEALAALNDGGCFVLYGPFMRAGRLTSDGDVRFHAQLTDADPEIGYKNDETVAAWLRKAGASAVERVEMPANNLAFIARR